MIEILTLISYNSFPVDTVGFNLTCSCIRGQRGYRGSVSFPDQIPPPSSGEVVGIVTAALLVTVVVTATAYLIIVRKRCVYAVCNT